VRHIARHRQHTFCSAVILVLFSAFAAFGQQSGPQMTQSVIGGGGGGSENGSLRVEGTIGQPVLGKSNGGSFKLEGGFWASGVPAMPTAANGSISGRVLDDRGLPVAGAVIKLGGTQARKTITDANGTYSFDQVETGGFYTVSPSRVNFSFYPTQHSFSLLGNSAEAAFTGSLIQHSSNSTDIDTPEYFVRQHYLDFLGREPDESGFNFWSDQILQCGADSGCIERKRTNVSAAYFLSIEFEKTGSLVHGLYQASFGVRPLFNEFIPDTRRIAEDVVIGRAGWEAQLVRNKQAFVDAFVERPRFRATFDGMSNDTYIDSLIARTGVAFTENERNALASDLAGNRLTRAAVLLRIADDARFTAAKRNETFVMMQYFGYLRRDPDESGYHFWLHKLNQFNGNFEQAEMVKAFITSGEYRRRF